MKRAGNKSTSMQNGRSRMFDAETSYMNNKNKQTDKKLGNSTVM